jgi:hypothetical protein
MATDGWGILAAVAESVGAVGTAGALLVAVKTLRDQRIDERRQQARHIVVSDDWHTVTEPHDGVMWTVENHSDLPIYAVGWFEEPDNYVETIGGDRSRTSLAPGASMFGVWQDRSEKAEMAKVMFRDADGRVWIRSSIGGLRHVASWHI